MPKTPLTAILLLALAGAAIWFAFLMLHRRVYARPRPFEHRGERYLWERDPDCPLWIRQFRRGRFRHADGRPVTDPTLARALQESWLIAHSESHEDHG